MTTHLSPERSALAVAPSPQRASFRMVIAVAPLVATALVLGPATAHGDYIYVANSNGTVNTIGEYTTSGATISAALVSGLIAPIGIAVSGANLFVTNDEGGTIGEYTTSGATVNAALVSGLNGPWGIAVSGSNLFVANTAGTIGEYSTSGATVNAALVSGLAEPLGIAIIPTPKPATLTLLGSALLGLGFVYLRRRGAKA